MPKKKKVHTSTIEKSSWYCSYLPAVLKSYLAIPGLFLRIGRRMAQFIAAWRAGLAYFTASIEIALTTRSDSVS